MDHITEIKPKRPYIRRPYRVVQKKGTVLLSTSLAWPAVAGCSWAETFSQLSSISFPQPCTWRAILPAQKKGPKRVGKRTQTRKMSIELPPRCPDPFFAIYNPSWGKQRRPTTDVNSLGILFNQMQCATALLFPFPNNDRSCSCTWKCSGGWIMNGIHVSILKVHDRR